MQSHLRAPCGVLRLFYLHAQTTADAAKYAPDKPWLFWLGEKIQRPQIEPHAWIKMAQVLGSLGYLHPDPMVTPLVLIIILFWQTFWVTVVQSTAQSTGDLVGLAGWHWVLILLQRRSRSLHHWYSNSQGKGGLLLTWECRYGIETRCRLSLLPFVCTVKWKCRNKTYAMTISYTCDSFL